jgi:branched-chain amino acid transport system ATP-binding protein
MTESVVLETRELTVQFGGLLALCDVSIDCHRGQLTGLIGPNGAGKTTLIDAVTGFVRATGQVFLEGEEISALPPHRRAHRGLTRTWQSMELFDDISVRANLEVASRRLTFAGGLRDFFGGRRVVDERARWALEVLDLMDVAERKPRELSQGQRKLVGVARALAGGPNLLLLDEPAAGLDQTATVRLASQLRGLIDLGHTILLVDHDMSLVLRVCERIHVIEFGRLIASGTPEEIRADSVVIRAYLGSSGSRA